MGVIIRRSAAPHKQIPRGPPPRFAVCPGIGPGLQPQFASSSERSAALTTPSALKSAPPAGGFGPQVQQHHQVRHARHAVGGQVRRRGVLRRKDDRARAVRSQAAHENLARVVDGIGGGNVDVQRRVDEIVEVGHDAVAPDPAAAELAGFRAFADNRVFVVDVGVAAHVEVRERAEVGELAIGPVEAAACKTRWLLRGIQGLTCNVAEIVDGQSLGGIRAFGNPDVRHVPVVPHEYHRVNRCRLPHPASDLGKFVNAPRPGVRPDWKLERALILPSCQRKARSGPVAELNDVPTICKELLMATASDSLSPLSIPRSLGIPLLTRKARREPIESETNPLPTQAPISLIASARASSVIVGGSGSAVSAGPPSHAAGTSGPTKQSKRQPATCPDSFIASPKSGSSPRIPQSTTGITSTS